MSKIIRGGSMRMRLVRLIGLLVSGVVIFLACSSHALSVVWRAAVPPSSLLQRATLMPDLLVLRQSIVDAYLLTEQIIQESEPAMRQRLSEQVRTWEAQYEARYAALVAQTPESLLKAEPMRKADRAARSFFSVWSRGVSPLVQQGKREQAQASVRSELQKHFREYLGAVDEEVGLATARVRSEEHGVRAKLSRQVMTLVSVGMGVLVFLAVSGWWLTLDILRSLQQLMDYVRAVTNEESTLGTKG